MKSDEKTSEMNVVKIISPKPGSTVVPDCSEAMILQ